MKNSKNICFKCGKETEDLLSFFMIDDWCQFEIKLCQDCTGLAFQEIFEAAEEWLCPTCKKNYCCTICGEDHHTKECPEGFPADIDRMNPLARYLFPSFRKRRIQWAVSTPYGTYPINFDSEGKARSKVISNPKEVIEMRSLLYNIRAITNQSEIKDMIKYYFNSKYGESAEGISDEFKNIKIDFHELMRKGKDPGKRILKKMMIRADTNNSIYTDTDSYMLPEISEEDVITIIKQLPDEKNLIIVTGRRGAGKTSAAIRLLECLKKDFLIADDIVIKDETTIFSSESLNKDLTVFPSFEFVPLGCFHRIGLLFHVWNLDYEKKVIYAKMYLYNKNKTFIKIDKAFSVRIPFCFDSSYNIYKLAKIAFLQKEMKKTE